MSIGVEDPKPRQMWIGGVTTARRLVTLYEPGPGEPTLMDEARAYAQMSPVERETLIAEIYESAMRRARQAPREPGPIGSRFD